jgi:hypothetical protein
VAITLGLAWCALGAGNAPAAPVFPCVQEYPGDSAPKEMLAIWMAGRAGGGGLPSALPVMGALVESELQNLPPGDQDSAGFFQMRVSIWDKGDYAGFPTNPELQAKWFVDQAVAVNQRRIAAGQVPYGDDSTQWGEWDADVLRPPAQYRGRYQLRLDEARRLTAGCPAIGPLPPGADSSPPPLKLRGKRVQDPVRRRAIVVEAACPVEACVANARGTIALPGAARVRKVRSSARQIPKGGKAALTLRVKPRLRRTLRSAFTRHGRLKAKVAVTALDAAGNATTARLVVRLRRLR